MQNRSPVRRLLPRECFEVVVIVEYIVDTCGRLD